MTPIPESINAVSPLGQGDTTKDFNIEVQVDIKVNGSEVSAILDSGSSFDIISTKFYKKLSKFDPKLRLSPKKKPATSVNGRVVECIGSITLPV